MSHSKRYSKELTHLTTIRLSPEMRQRAEIHADYLGISFSDFVRQSINRNILVCCGIEEEISGRTLSAALGNQNEE